VAARGSAPVDVTAPARKPVASAGAADQRDGAVVIRVAVADDHQLVRTAFVRLLDMPDVTVVGEATDGDEAHRLAVRARPDVVLMDLRMPRVDGIEATRSITADPACAGTRVIVLTTYETDDDVFAALGAGASGYLTKDIDAADLAAAIRVVAAGDAVLAPSVTRRVARAFAAGATRPPDGVLRDLDRRELELLTLVGRGLTNEEIGRQLLMSPFTAKTHVCRLMARLGVRDRIQLVIIAHEHRLVT
jgi:DNA-binding NarL/FixJ family response regulator